MLCYEFISHSFWQAKQAYRSHSFPCMNRDQRRLIHELAECYGCETQSYDYEPSKNVVATAHKYAVFLLYTGKRASHDFYACYILFENCAKYLCQNHIKVFAWNSCMLLFVSFSCKEFAWNSCKFQMRFMWATFACVAICYRLQRKEMVLLHQIIIDNNYNHHESISL